MSSSDKAVRILPSLLCKQGVTCSIPVTSTNLFNHLHCRYLTTCLHSRWSLVHCRTLQKNRCAKTSRHHSTRIRRHRRIEEAFPEFQMAHLSFHSIAIRKQSMHV